MSYLAPVFNETQQLLSLCCVSYAGMSGQPARNPLLLLELLQKTMMEIQPLGQKWRIVWGPAVARQRLSMLSNRHMFFIAQSADRPATFVIVVRGTNFFSIGSVLDLDDAFRQRQWPYQMEKTISKPRISAGSARALAKLRSLRVSCGLPGAHSTMEEFLRSVGQPQPTPIHLVTTGHSFGGALAILLALFLQDTQLDWDPEMKAEIQTVSFAAPPVGNRDFVEYAESRLERRMRCLYNPFDLTVYAYTQQQIEEFKRRYVSIVGIPMLWFATRNLYRLMTLAGIEYCGSQRCAVPLCSEIQPAMKFLIPQWIWQHSQGYLDALGLREYLNLKAILMARPGKSENKKPATCSRSLAE